MRTAVRLVGWWLVLWGIWLLYVGQHHAQEVVAGAIAAALSTALAVGVARAARSRYRLDPQPLARAWRLPWNVVSDFAVVSIALARGRPRGEWNTIELSARPDAQSGSRRALLAVLASIAPNRYVVDLDAERGVVEVHNLDSRRARRELP